MALRNMVPGKSMMSDGADVMPDVREVRERMGAYADAVRGGTIRAANGERFTDVVNIGIGGSDLGPAMVARALSPFVAEHLTLHFVSNVDGADLGDTLKLVPLATTLFIVCSKTFTTLETMTNAQSARKAVAEALSEGAVADHFCAVSTQLDLIAQVRHQERPGVRLLGTGSAGAIPYGRRSASRSRSVSARRLSRSSFPAARTSTSISSRRRSRRTSRR